MAMHSSSVRTRPATWGAGGGGGACARGASIENKLAASTTSTITREGAMAHKRIPRSVRGPGRACGCERWTDGGRAVDTFFLEDARFSVLDSPTPQDIVSGGGVECCLRLAQ